MKGTANGKRQQQVQTDAYIEELKNEQKAKLAELKKEKEQHLLLGIVFVVVFFPISLYFFYKFYIVSKEFDKCAQMLRKMENIIVDSPVESNSKTRTANSSGNHSENKSILDTEREEYERCSRRASEFLKIREYAKVNELADAMLEISPASGMAYYYKFMAEQSISSINEIGKRPETLYSKHFEMACDLLGEKDKAVLLEQKKIAAKAKCKTFRVPYGVNELKEKMFGYMPPFEEIIIPGYVKRIGNKAFYGMCELKRAMIEYGVEEIGDEAFSQTTLSEITVPGSVKRIGKEAFTCFYVGDETGKNVEELDEELDYDDEIIYNTLKKITIEDGVEEIDDEAFSSSLAKSIVIPKSVKKIGKEAFAHSEALESVIIGSGVEEIGDEAFSLCELLKEVTIPAGVKKVGKKAFNCGDDKINLDCVKIESATAEMSRDMFSSCEELHVASKDQMLLFGAGCDNVYVNGQLVTTLVIPDNMTEISDQAFQNANFFSELIISEGVTKIGKRAFNGCSKLREITISSTVEDIGYMAIGGCHNIESIKVSPDNKKYRSIDNSALIDVESKKLLFCLRPNNIPTDGSVEVIDHYALDSSTGVTVASLPDCVTEIGAGVFGNCNKLETVYIHANLKKIGVNAFCADSLKEIDVDPDNKFFSNVNGCLIENETKRLLVKTKEGVIPNDGSVKEICDCSCVGYSDAELVIPDSVEKIGTRAFAFSSNLKRIVVPSGVKKLYAWCAFLGCNSLSEVCFENTENWVNKRGEAVTVSDPSKMAKQFRDNWPIDIMQKNV